MEKNNNDTVIQKRAITASLVVGWLFGTIFAISGFVLLFTETVTGLLVLLLAAVLLPPANRIVSERLNVVISGPLKFMIAIVLIVAIGISANDPQANDALTEAPNVPQAQSDKMIADASASDAAAPSENRGGQESTARDTGPKTSVGNGTHVVGVDVAPGTYRSSRAATCYWARLSGFGRELGDIIGNGNNSPEIVTIIETDAAFESSGCGQWEVVETTFPSTPSTSVSDGTYVVGGHIAPGRYRADGSPDRLCYWSRLSSFAHGGVDNIITNGNSPTVIEIAPSDAGFTSFGCGTWSQI